MLYSYHSNAYIAIGTSTDILCHFHYSKDDRLPNLDATQRTTDTENNSQVVIPTGERKHFPSNITKIGYAIFSVSCTYYMSMCCHKFYYHAM